MAIRLDTREAGFTADFSRFMQARRETGAQVDREVASIIEGVRSRGDAALVEYTERFDHNPLTSETMRIDPQETERAWAAAPRHMIEALDLTAKRIHAYHLHQVPDDLDYRDSTGVRLGARWRAIPAVGIYVPGGTAAYPSSVLMNAIPAQVAGVPRIVMVAPAPGGTLHPLVLAAAHRAGVTEIYRIGGAQAIAALAFGTASIDPVDKIVGPGNAYVATAKRQVFGTVGIDMVAGPSEILVVADSDNDPAWIAADLLSQAEHDASAQAVLIVDSPEFGDAVADKIEAQLQSLPRSEIATASWQAHGAIIRVADFEEAVPLINRLAPEHLELAIANPDELALRIDHAGAIFLGRFTPEAIGDYVAGPNHVLPTARGARFASGLGVLDFMKRTSFVACNATSLAAIGPAAITLAQAEGLDAHARSVALRLASSDRKLG
jgi:histidinol dehydrogenase